MLAALLIAIVAEVVVILVRNDGVFLYSLDDPYIHLELARGIAAGLYGLNGGEYVAPSSSILWPFLLAPFALIGVERLIPLLLNLGSVIASVIIVDDLLRLVLKPGVQRREMLLALVTFVVAVCTNLVGLAFTGMEHSLQVLLSLLALRGLITVCSDDEVPRWLGLVLILGPLVRYENLALSGAAVMVLMARRKYVAAVSTGAVIALTVGAFSAFLMLQGLAPLPASVTAKAVMVKGLVIEGIPVRLTITDNLEHPEGVLLFAALLFLLARSFTIARGQPERPLAMALSLALLLHLLFGRVDWFGRYEIYIWVTALLGVGYLYRGLFAALFTRLPKVAAAFVGLALLPAALIYGEPTLRTPAASWNLYRQQYQMGRLASELYGHPVAANDIGLVSYRNDAYVLDVFGLASAEALRLRMANPADGRWMEPIAKNHDVGMAMVYDPWFGTRMPQEWTRVAVLTLKPFDPIASPYAEVSIYSTSPSALPAVEAALDHLAKTLPAGVTLERPVAELPITR